MDVDVMPNEKLAHHISFDNPNGLLITLWLIYLNGY
jgi:hypothetical protein